MKNAMEHGIKLAKMAAEASHDCYRPGDADMDEATREHVEVGGLSICRRCGAAERELNERFCKPPHSQDSLSERKP